MFIGEYEHSVDEKGRVAMPAKFRDMLGTKAVVTRGIDHCMYVYTAKEWEILAGKLAQLPLTQSNARSFARLMLAGAMELECDKQGRVLLPEYLRRYARVGKNVVIAGLYNRLEIWDAHAWARQQKELETHSEEIVETLGALGV